MIVVKTVHPKRKLDEPAMNEAWLAELKKYGKFIQKDFDGIVEPWKGAKPVFQLAYYLDQEGFKLVVRVMGPDEGRKKFWYLNNGTRAHTIRAKPGGRLAFPSIYNAGSTPGKIRTYPASSGGDTIFTPEVQHPGTEARDFTGTIAKDHEKPFYEWMRAATGRVAQASGQAIK